LLGGLVNPAGDVGHKCRAVFQLRHARTRITKNKRPRTINNGCVMVDFGDVAGLMGYSRSRRQTGGNGIVELLSSQYLDI